ncbi:MAG TPA: hypothetical protein VM054_01255 [bacterium]|nr:hypothetical protein [bacterium]
MRKLLYMLLAALFVLPLFILGCEGKGAGEGEAGDDTTAEVTPGDGDQVTAAAVAGPHLAAFYDTVAQLGFLYHLDSKGQLHFLNFDSGEWDADGEPCPGKGPFDLAAFHDPDSDTWGVLAVDGEGALWHSTKGWDRVAEPVGTKGQYALAAFYDTTYGEPVISTMAPDGKLYVFNGEAWDLVHENVCPGKGPFDLTVFYDKTSDLYWTSVVDSAGKAYDFIAGEWADSGMPIAAKGPFRITGFHDVAADAYLFYVIDGAGNLYVWEGDDWTDVGAKVPGKAPFDLDAFYDPDADAYYVMSIDSAGKVYQFTGDEWTLQY